MIFRALFQYYRDYRRISNHSNKYDDTTKLIKQTNKQINEQTNKQNDMWMVESAKSQE